MLICIYYEICIVINMMKSNPFKIKSLQFPNNNGFCSYIVYSVRIFKSPSNKIRVAASLAWQITNLKTWGMSSTDKNIYEANERSPTSFQMVRPHHLLIVLLTLMPLVISHSLLGSKGLRVARVLLNQFFFN